MFSCVGIFQQLYTSHFSSNLNKQETRGSCCLPEKQCQLINTFGQSFNYTITLIKREKNHYLLFEIQIVLYVKFQCIFVILLLFPPLEKGEVLHLNNREST